MFPTLNCRGKLLSLHQPVVMGMLPAGPGALEQAGQMLAAGASLIGLQAAGRQYTVAEELELLGELVAALRQHLPHALLCVHTARPEVAAHLLGLGAHLLYDLAGSEAMMQLASASRVPYVLCASLYSEEVQHAPQTDVVEGRWQYVVGQINRARSLGVTDVVIDPGVGDAKNPEQNWQLLYQLGRFGLLELPLLAGSFEGGFWGLPAAEAAHLYPLLQWKALEQGIHILKTSDVPTTLKLLHSYNQYAGEL